MIVFIWLLILDGNSMQMTLQIQKFIAIKEKYRMYGLSEVIAKDLTFSINGERRLV